MSEYLEPEDLFAVLDELEPVKAHWFGVGLGLKLRKSDLEAIKKDHGESLECLREMLHLWLDRTDSRPTWQEVIEVLRKPAAAPNQKKLANTLARKHCPEATLAQERGADTAVICQARDDSNSSLTLDDNHPTAVAIQPEDQCGNAPFLYLNSQSTEVAEDDQENPSPAQSITGSTGTMVIGRQPSVQLSQPPIPEGYDEAQSPGAQSTAGGSGFSSSVEDSLVSQRSSTGFPRVTTDGYESDDEAQSPDAQSTTGGSGVSSSVEDSLASQRSSTGGAPEDDSSGVEGSMSPQRLMADEPQGGAVTESLVGVNPELNSGNSQPAQPVPAQPVLLRRTQLTDRWPPSRPEAPTTKTLPRRDIFSRTLSQLSGHDIQCPGVLVLVAVSAVLAGLLALAVGYCLLPSRTGGESNECDCVLVHRPNEVINAVYKDISDWRWFGDELGVSNTYLDWIKSEEQRELQRLKKVVRMWYDHRPHGACWEEVVNAIKTMGKQRLAKNVADEHGLSWKELSQEVLECIQGHATAT